MQERNLYRARTRCEFRIVKWLGTVPEIAMCPFCNREFRTPLTRMRQSINALENLQVQFYGHKCQPKRLVIEAHLSAKETDLEFPPPIPRNEVLGHKRWRKSRLLKTPPLSLATQMFVVGALNNGERVVGTPLTSAEVHAVLTNLDSDPLIEDAVAGCRETSANDLQWLSEHGRKLARESLAHNPSTPDGVLRHLMQDPDPDVQFWTGYSVALNVCDPKMLRTFWERESNKAQRKDGNAFYRLATNACTPNDVLELLADYPGDVGPQAKAGMQAYSTKTTGHRVAK